MESPDVPYKSRLFNWLNRQILYWGDRTSRAGRTLQVAAIWSIQILVYPLYSMVQAGRLTGQKLGQKMRQLSQSKAEQESLSEAISPMADRPIKQVFAVLEPWLQQRYRLQGLTRGELPLEKGLGAEIVSEEERLIEREKQGLQGIPEASEAIAIQGIASDWATKKLVLVTPDHQILDLLTPEQQEYLHQQMVLEVATLKRYQRSLKETAERLRVPSYNAQDSRLLPPIRWCWRGIDWVQRSPVAIAINLFGESSLVAAVPPNSPQVTSDRALSPEGETLIPPLPEELLTQLDGAIATWETQLSQSQWIRTLDEITIPAGWLTKRGGELTPSSSELRNSESTASGEVTLQELIQAAIAHFFGRSPATLATPMEVEEPSLPENSPPPLAQPNPSPVALPESPNEDLALSAEPSPPPEQTPELEADPWLVWEDLYNDITDSVEEEPDVEDAVDVPAIAQLPAAPPTPQLKKLSPSSSKGRSTAKATPSKPQPKAPPSLSKPPKTTAKPSVSPPAKKVSRVPSPQPSPNPSEAIAPTPVYYSNDEVPEAEWLEVTARPTGYVKHPLEQLLEWLDSLMLWAEELILAVWQWIYRRIP